MLAETKVEWHKGLTSSKSYRFESCPDYTKLKDMKKYHLTILRDGKYETVFGEMSSISSFLMIEKELGREVHVLYSRELTDEEWFLNRLYTSKK
jgi:hypothetical protein